MAFPWMTFWNIVLVVGLGGFSLLVLAVIPLGARDIRRLFARLDASERDEDGDAGQADDAPG